MVTDHCRYRNHATHHIHFHSQQNESSCIFSPCPPRSLQYRRGYCPFLAFFMAQGFGCSTSSIKRFGGRDSLFGRAAILNFGHTEQAQ